MKKLLFSAFVLLSAFGSASGATIWINEIRYENDGLDVDEFVEFIVDTSVVDIADVSLSVYNGSNGALRFTETNFIAGDMLEGSFAVFSVSPNSSLQNSSEGISINVSGATIDFISYEGSFTAIDGPAMGITATDIGVSQPLNVPIGSSLGLTGTGMMGGADGGDFTWAAFDAPPANGQTPGSLNVGQTLVVPEPGTTVLLGLFGLVSLLARRRL